MILRDARIGSEITDVLVHDGAIAKVGAIAERAETELLLEGRTLLPGLWDNHVHMTEWSLQAKRPSVFHALSASEAASILRAAASDTNGAREQGTLVGTGFRDGLWSDRPTVSMLDGISRDRPIVVVSADLHSVWLNSAAIGQFGVWTDESGILREGPAFEIEQRINDLPDDVLDAWVIEAGKQAATRGVVGFVDLEMAWNADVWLRRVGRGFSSQRVEFGIYPRHLDRAIDNGFTTGQRLYDLISVGPLKIMTDGSLGTRTAYCFDPYPGMHGPHSHGILAIPPEEVRSLIERGRDAGIESTVHAIGDRANAHVLDVFEALGIAGRIEHAQLLTRDDVARLAALNVVASVQPEHALDDRDIADHHWAGRTDRAFLLRSIVDAGGELALGSDAPVAPLDPWIAIAAAVARAKDGRDPWHPQEAIDIGTAIGASVRSSIAPGQPADLVAVDADPSTADPETLRSMPVALTLLGGNVTHSTL